MASRLVGAVILTAPLLIATLAACAAPGSPPGANGGRAVRFTVVAQGQVASTYGFDTLGSSPRLVVGADAAARAELERLVGQAVRADLPVAVFQGVQRTGGYGVGVDDVRVAGDAVEVRATFARPAPDAIVTQALTLPFVVIDVARSELPRGRLRFVLRDATGAQLGQVEIQNP